MNIVRKDIDAVNATITIEVTPSDYTEKVEKTLKDYRKKANFSGFRPGSAPMGLVKKMYGKAILAEEVNKVLSDALYGYIRENNIQILGEPLPNETEQKQIDFDTDTEFEFVFDIAIAPELDITLNKKDVVKYYNIEITDKMIDDQIQNYCGRFGSYAQVDEVVEKDVVKGHMLELNADGKVNEEGIKVEDAVLSPFYMKDDAQKAIFVGAKKDSVVVFNPQKAYGNEAEISSMLHISKEEAHDIQSDFSFQINGITRYEESPIDQTLFDKVFGEGVVTSEEDFRTKVAEGLKDSFVADSDYKFAIDARAHIVKKLDKVVFPDEFLKRWVLASNENMTQETVDKEFPLMLEDLKWYIMKNKLAEANEVKVEKDDIENYARKMAKIQFAQYGMANVPEDILDNYAKDMMKKEDAVKNIYDKVIEDKVVEIIKNSIKLNNQEVSVEDFNKMFE